MGRIGQLILFTEEVMDELYPRLSTADREIVAEVQDEIDTIIADNFLDGRTVEDTAKDVLATVRNLQYDRHWNARQVWTDTQWEARVS